MIVTSPGVPVDAAPTAARTRIVARRGRRLPLTAEGRAGAVLLVGIVLAAFLLPVLAPRDPLRQDVRFRLTPPAWMQGGESRFPLGSDQVGRDVLARLLDGARVSLIIGISTVALAASVGTLIGLAAGWWGGLLEVLTMRLADIQIAFPFLVVAIAVIAVLGPGVAHLVLILAIWSWAPYARVVRGDVLSLRRREYVLAATAAGADPQRILLRHLLPNLAPTLIVLATFGVAQMVIAESSLSFLGLGVQPPSPSWGSMLADGRDQLDNAWWVAVFPALAILLTVLGLNLLGDALRDWLDPRVPG